MSQPGPYHRTDNAINKKLVYPVFRIFFFFEKATDHLISQDKSQSPHQTIPTHFPTANLKPYGIYIPQNTSYHCFISLFIYISTKEIKKSLPRNKSEKRFPYSLYIMIFYTKCAINSSRSPYIKSITGTSIIV